MKETYTLTRINEIAKSIIESATSKTILFYGEMGVGKTTLISAMVKVLGGQDKVTSPTFSLVNEYNVDNDKVYHFDFYRLNNETEALDIGLEDYLYSNNWCFIEWPEKIKNLLPEDATELFLSLGAESQREIKLIKPKNRV